MSGEQPAVITWPNGKVVSPSGCGSCGVDQLSHFRRWSSSNGWHPWIEPSQEQRKERMLARRAARQNTP